ncbi:NACHT domain-containing protein [Nostoc sp. UIC 10630]|uniref:NACHT domain-containing protein n=1 Tax=Nostoc sp. UIC 10630 TaxID=2100146 RepID=UPI0013D48606|nr:NACHT domain-containing protein [Nostoc sp. UIC 10630]NEU80970.1 NACHT domain-containing protein [Nostoc sp. UIC 10630]
MPESQDPKKVINNDLPNSQFGGGFINAESVNAQRIGGDILNFFFGQQTTPVGDPARPKNERILLAAVKEEVTARLRQSLHNAVLINLGKEPQPQQVKRFWDTEIKIGFKPAKPLPDTTTILEVFDSQEIAGKLLILGAPGSGKTTTQLELAEELTKRAEEQPDCPVPVLFNLSSWKDDRQSLTNWLLAELKSKYGVSIKLGEEWVNNHQLLPLLDGLDELEPQRQELCVHEINQFLAGETRPLYLVVCSRIEEYSNYSTQLQLNGAIYLQPLTNNQICNYLTSINFTELWSTISSDLDLLELIKTPLLLSITVLASQEISLESWQNLTSTADLIQYLLEAYIGRMLTRNINSVAYFQNKYPSAEQTRIWLVWLAQQMQRESKTEFLIEEMQPYLLNDNHLKKALYISVELVSRLATGFTLGAIVGLTDGLTNGLFFGIVGCVVSIKINSYINNIEILRWSKERTNHTFPLLFILFLILILIFTPIAIVIGATNKLVGVTTVLIILLLFTGLSVGFYASEVQEKKIPNQGIWKSLRYAVISGLITGLIGSLILGIGGWLINGLTFGLKIGLGTFFIGGLYLGLTFGGLTCIQHFTLRLILYRNGYIPWNYARFLDYCTERLFLQRVGGRYRFIHKLLQDHFAQMEFKRN